ncbi:MULTISPECIES: universal stress protein [unclassified Rhodococcus (in: high G+C Gram-positive bacteria)]|uniref:universal stress protein n=1 Tax=Rhodococcus sp. SJ-3 TaxID=3454628 RepID=UPI003F7AA4D3
MSVAVVHADTPEGRAALRAGAREASDRGQTLLVLAPLDDPTDSDAVVADVREVLGEGDWELLTEVHNGDSVGTVVELLARSGAERAVVGSRGRTATGKFLLERGLQRMIIEAAVPVLVVKDE